MAYTRHHRNVKYSKEEFLRRTKNTINDCVRLASLDNLVAGTIDGIKHIGKMVTITRNSTAVKIINFDLHGQLFLNEVKFF